MTIFSAALVLAAATSPPAPITVDSPAIQERLAFVRDFRVDITEGQTQAAYVQTHHELLDLYWRHLASDAAPDMQRVTLLPRGSRFSACGRARARNAYCPESAEIILEPQSIDKRQTLSRNVRQRLIALTILAHEWGHHVNHSSSRGAFSNREEDAADWRAGRYLAWLMDNGALSVKDFTDAANLFFSIGDFHLQSPHNNPKARYTAFIAGVEAEGVSPERQKGWVMDTAETFSKVLPLNPESPSKRVQARVYRFEIERGGQIAGNILSGLFGAASCALGSSDRCANSLQQVGKAKPDGWYRLRKLSLDCVNRSFDIEGDGIRRQPLQNDRKGQAQRIANRTCPALVADFKAVRMPTPR